MDCFDLINLKVETKDGQLLGSVRTFDVDVSAQTIVKYYIKSESIIKRLLQIEHDLIISRSQVISMDKKRMIVSDLVLKEGALADVKEKTLPSPAGISTITSASIKR